MLRTWVEPNSRVAQWPDSQIAKGVYISHSGRGGEGGMEDPTPPENDIVTLGTTRNFCSPAARTAARISYQAARGIVSAEMYTDFAVAC